MTEGLLKADIAHCLTGRSFVAVAGVNSLNGLESALRCMAQNGTKLVVEAYDMDKLENEYVAEADRKSPADCPYSRAAKHKPCLEYCLQGYR